MLNKKVLYVILILIIVILILFFTNKKDDDLPDKTIKEEEEHILDKNKQKELLKDIVKDLAPENKKTAEELEAQKKILDQLKAVQPKEEKKRPDFINSEKEYQEFLLNSIR